MYSIVLVLRTFSYFQDEKHNNLQRFLQIGMATFDRFMEQDEIKDFFVVVPSQEEEAVRKALCDAYPTWPWNVLNEDALVHASLPPGWARQQTIKFAISMLVQTETYLIVDDDTILTKPFHEKDMYADGTRQLIMNRAQIDFPFFYLWSCQALKYDFDKVQDFPYHMGITPQIFVTSVVRDLVKWLVLNYGGQKVWQLFLANNKFTEYTMYWMWLIKHNLTGSHYTTSTDANEVYGNVITTDMEKSQLAKSVKTMFAQNEKYFFSFIQSSLPFIIKDISDMVTQHLPKQE